MKYSFLPRIEDSLVFDGDYLEIYIPKFYFDKEIAFFKGDTLQTIGIFTMKNYMGEERNFKNAQTVVLKFPMNIELEYDSFRDEVLQLENDNEPTSYKIFSLSKGCKVIKNIKQEQTSENTKKFIFLFHGGNIPKLEYEQLLEIYLDCAELNGTKLNNPSVIFEYIVAELCRNRNKIEEPFRKLIGKTDKDSDKVSNTDYKLINLKKLPALNSTFNAMIFEDMQQSILTSIKKTKTGETEKESPLEDIIKY